MFCEGILYLSYDDGHITMTDKPVKAPPGETGLQPIKRPYARPNLREFGAVNRLTQGTGGNGNDGDGQHTMKSDRAFKENVVRIGDHPLGIGLYLFDYRPEFRDRWGHGRQFGVMADEVQAVLPEAVSVHDNGYKVVDYAMLGISLARH